MAAGESGDARKAPNLVLRRIREQERHETREEFAEAMARVALELGEDVFPDAKYVGRLEAGHIRYPRPTYRRVLAKLCGRPFSELGFSAPVLSPPAGDDSAGLDESNDGAVPSKRLNPALHDAILASGLELRQIARKIGVDPKSVQRWMTRGVVPHPRHRWKTCEILGREESDLWPDAVAGRTRASEKFGVVPADTSLSDSMAAGRLTIASPEHLQEILVYLREQWHALVRTDNLLGPRFALTGVLHQISVVEALRSVLRDEQRIEVARLGAMYAESAAWLYEDHDNISQARFWTSQAMEWAYEGDDERMLAWTIFRRAQQAAAIPDAAQTIGLAQAARRNEEKLATPTRAAIRVQEAYGHALDGNDYAAQRLLDEAHSWAAGDSVGDAREGHGSYCTPGYIEIQRGHCWLAAGQPKKAIPLYENSLRTLPTVYQRNRAATLTRLAMAYASDSEPEQAANTAHEALPVARSAGSKVSIHGGS
jgi:transcriptional regulator with XRE-family HTH domain